jgi:phosphohistidine phosphatase
MNLLVVRHAIAEERESFAATGEPDDLRPLTDEGRRRMRKAARGLRTLVDRPDVIATSPFVRARETAAILARVWDDQTPVEERAALRPRTRPSAFLSWLKGHDEKLVAVVGHEPHLSCLVTWLMTGAFESRLDLKKGSATLLAFAARPRAGGAKLEWSLTPSQLRAFDA